MPARKIVDEGEVKRWHDEGRTYTWMVAEYRRKYDLEIAQSAFSNLRARRGWDRRITWDPDSLPWHVLLKHRSAWHVHMLQAEARKRAGFELRAEDERRLASWLAEREAEGTVVHYDQEHGFTLVPRGPEDTGLIREPKRRTRLRGRA